MSEKKHSYFVDTILGILAPIGIVILFLFPIIFQMDSLKEIWKNSSDNEKGYSMGFLYLGFFLILRWALHSISKKKKIHPFMCFVMYFFTFLFCSWFSGQLDLEAHLVWIKFLWICLFLFPWYALYYVFTNHHEIFKD